MLLDIVLVIDRRERARSHLLVLVDTSESMGLSDPYDDATARRISGGLRGTTDVSEVDAASVRERTRLELARQSLEPLMRDLGDGREVAVYGFDGKATRIEVAEPLTALAARGASTAVGDALSQALAPHRGQPLAGVLVVSDGQSNGGEDPRNVAQQAGRDGTVIHALVVGSERGPSNVRLTDVEVSPVVFVRDPLQISVSARIAGNAGADRPGQTRTPSERRGMDRVGPGGIAAWRRRQHPANPFRIYP